MKVHWTDTAEGHLDAIYAYIAQDMDPPYQGVCGNRDTRYLQSVQFCEFVEALDSLNQKGIRYLVSYDGRTGVKTFGKLLPEELNLTLIELYAGRSTQATLLGRADITIPKSLPFSKTPP